MAECLYMRLCCIELVHKLHLLLTSCSPKFRKRICPREAVFRTKVHLTYPSIEACKGNNEHLEHFCFLYKELPVCKIYLPIVVYTIIIFEPKFLLLFINAFKEKQRISYRSFKKLLSKSLWKRMFLISYEKRPKDQKSQKQLMKRVSKLI